MLPFPSVGQVFFDGRGPERCLRVTWRGAGRQIVVSLWRDDTCVGTVHLSRTEASRLIAALATGLAESEATSHADEAV